MIALRNCNMRQSWLVIEMKNRMRLRAAEQATAALERLGKDPLFPLVLEHAGVIFVVGKRRKTDRTIMRDIKRIDAGSWSVVPQLKSSGECLFCP